MIAGIGIDILLYTVVVLFVGLVLGFICGYSAYKQMNDFKN